MRERQQNSTTHPITFLMVSSTDHVTGAAGLAVTATISKDGGGFASPAGAVSEIGNGWYALVGNATDRNTLGALLVHATAPGADPMDVQYTITGYDPFNAAGLGLTNLDATIGSRSTYAGGPVASVTAPVTLATPPPTLAQIVGGVWDEPKASHTTAGSFGLYLDAPVSSRLPTGSYVTPSDPWAVTLPGGYGPDTAGKIVGTNLDANVGSRSTYAGGPVASVVAKVAATLAASDVTGNLPADIKAVTGIVVPPPETVPGPSAAPNKIRLASTASDQAGFYDGQAIRLVGVGTGSGQEAVVTGYVGGSTKEATVQTAAPDTNWVIPPDGTTQYQWDGYAGSSAPRPDPWSVPLPGSYAAGTAGAIIGGIIAALATVGSGGGSGGGSGSGGGLALTQLLTGDMTVGQALVAILTYACGTYGTPRRNAVNPAWLDYARRNPATGQVAYLETVDQANKLRTGFTPIDLG